MNFSNLQVGAVLDMVLHQHLCHLLTVFAANHPHEHGIEVAELIFIRNRHHSSVGAELADYPLIVISNNLPDPNDLAFAAAE